MGHTSIILFLLYPERIHVPISYRISNLYHLWMHLYFAYVCMYLMNTNIHLWIWLYQCHTCLTLEISRTATCVSCGTCIPYSCTSFIELGSVLNVRCQGLWQMAKSHVGCHISGRSWKFSKYRISWWMVDICPRFLNSELLTKHYIHKSIKLHKTGWGCMFLSNLQSSKWRMLDI